MKSNRKKKLIYLILLGIFFAFSPIIATNLIYTTNNSNKSSEYYDEINFINENLKISKISGKIHIDNNWTDARDAGICTGNGTYSEPYVIEDLVIDGGGSGSCILIENTDMYFRIENCTVYNSGGLWGDAGIRLDNVDNGQLIDNNCSSNYLGIYLSNYCNYNNVSGNTANSNEISICLYDSDNNNISGNIVNHNYRGIYSNNCNNNNISGNTVNYNEFTGIQLYESLYNTISENIINYSEYGIYLGESHYNTISGNIVNNNTQNGIQLTEFCGNNEISGNKITNNTLNGVLIDNSDSNTIYNNTFIGNTVNALDSGTGNQWDYNSLGNFWDDYGGVDANDDRIGDTPYDVPPAGGSVDNFPIWEDGDDVAPNIMITSPTTNQIFGNNAPGYNITIYDLSTINATWYTIDGGITNYTFTGLSGTINQTAWNNAPEGEITITFYALDRAGNIGTESIIVIKHIPAPPAGIIAIIEGIIGSVSALLVISLIIWAIFNQRKRKKAM